MLVLSASHDVRIAFDIVRTCPDLSSHRSDFQDDTRIAGAMTRRSRAPSGRLALKLSTGYWLLALAGVCQLSESQVCEDYSVDSGVYW